MPKLFFPEGMGGVHKTCGNSGGVGGGYFCVQKMENPGRRGGDLCEFRPWWGHGYFLELHNVSLILFQKDIISFTSHIDYAVQHK